MNINNVPLGTLVDADERSRLPHITDADICYFLHYRTKGGYSANRVNNEIDNFKKPVDLCKKNSAVREYKNNAISFFSTQLCGFFRENLIPHIEQSEILLIPMPTSKAEDDELFDNRLILLCENVERSLPKVTMGNYIHTIRSVQPVHDGGARDPTIIKSNLAIDRFTPGNNQIIVLIDDVLTTGCHFRACKNLLKENGICNGTIIGIFLTRQE